MVTHIQTIQVHSYGNLDQLKFERIPQPKANNAGKETLL